MGKGPYLCWQVAKSFKSGATVWSPKFQYHKVPQGTQKYLKVPKRSLKYPKVPQSAQKYLKVLKSTWK